MDRSDVFALVEVRDLAARGIARERRLAAGLSLSEIAQAVGVAENTIWRWESGDRRPRGEAALRYKALLDELASRYRQKKAAKA